MDESGTDGVECSRKVASGRRNKGAIRSLVNTMDLQLECASLAIFILFMAARQCYGKRRRYLDLDCTDGQPQRIDRY